MRLYHAIFLALLGSANSFGEQSAPVTAYEPMVIRYYDRGVLDARHAYKFELIRAALEITRPEYGNYQVEPYRLEPSSKRQPILLEEGTQLNLIWASPGTDHAQGDIIPIPIDILHGLLGYRACLINTATHPQGLAGVRNLNDLQSLRLGQGFHWADIAVYKYNSIKPVQASSFDGLFEMLSFNRFDCLALGITEINLAFHEKKTAYPSLDIDQHLLIFYEYPVYFYVSKKFPQLAERLNLGLTRLLKNGQFDSLFHQHFADDLQQLKLEQRHLICLESPYSHSTKKCLKPENKYFKSLSTKK